MMHEAFDLAFGAFFGVLAGVMLTLAVLLVGLAVLRAYVFLWHWCGDHWHALVWRVRRWWWR